MSPLAAPDPQPIRLNILEAATARFQQYGYGKTTMAEIARDCEMSAANLYRYFDNKADIAAELARGCLGRKLERLATVVENNERDAAKCIENWLLEAFNHTWEMCLDQPRMNELVDDVCNQRPDIVHEHYSQKRELLAGVLRTATESGELCVDDPDEAANLMLIASITFDVPHFLHMQPRETHEQNARKLARLLVDGLADGAGK